MDNKEKTQKPKAKKTTKKSIVKKRSATTKTRKSSPKTNVSSQPSVDELLLASKKIVTTTPTKVTNVTANASNNSIMVDKKVKTFDEAKKKIEAKIKLFSENYKGKFDIKPLVSVAKLMEAGVHNGLRRAQWNPKMCPFIYQKKNQKRQIIDILKILVFLNRAYSYLLEISKEGGKILFVCTKNDIIKQLIKDNAEKCNYYYMTQRWLGGTLTNYKTVVNSINKLKRLTDLIVSPDIEKYSKKEQLLINKKINKLEKFIGGIKNMGGLPHVLVVTDPVVEHNAVVEAKALNIPVIGIANTNADPNMLDFIIPGNTFSTRSLWLLISVLIDAIHAAKGIEQNVVGKADDNIVLPAIPKQQRNIVVTRKFKNHQ